MNNKFLSIAASTAIVASALVFTGCGDSDSSSAAATTPTASTASGTLTATAIKGAWSGVNYTVTANGTLANTTSSMSNGVFSFGTAKDNVSIDLGLVKWNIVNPTSGSISDFASASNVVLANGTALTSANLATVKSNLLATIAFINNNTATVETTGFNAGTLITNLTAMKAKGLDLTSTGMTFINGLAANATAAGIKNSTDAVSAVNTYGPALNTAMVSAAAAARAAATASLNSLNNTNLNGTFLILTNASGFTSVVDLSSNANNNLSLVGNAGAMAGGTTWNASGSTIILGTHNTSATNASYSTLTFKSAISTSAGTPVTYFNSSDGFSGEYTLAAIKTNMSNTTAFGADYNAFKNITLTANGVAQLYINTVNQSVPGVAGARGVNLSYGNGTQMNASTTANFTSSYKVGSDALGLPTVLQLFKDNATGNAKEMMNLSFDYNPNNKSISNGGVIATILYTLESAYTSFTSFFFSLFQ